MPPNPPSSSSTGACPLSQNNNGQKVISAYITVKCKHGGERLADSRKDDHFDVVPDPRGDSPYPEPVFITFHGDTSLKGKLFDPADKPCPEFTGDGFGEVKLLAPLQQGAGTRANILKNLFTRDSSKIWHLKNVPGKTFEIRYYDPTYFTLSLNFPAWKSFRSGYKLDRKIAGPDNGAVKNTTSYEEKSGKKVVDGYKNSEEANKKEGTFSNSYSQTKNNVTQALSETKTKDATIFSSSSTNLQSGVSSSQTTKTSQNGNGQPLINDKHSVTDENGLTTSTDRNRGSSLVTTEESKHGKTTTYVDDDATGESDSEVTQKGVVVNSKAGTTSVQQNKTVQTAIGRDKPISLKRNGQQHQIDALSVIGGALNLFNGFMGLADTIKEWTPSVGFYADLSMQLFQGKVDINWGWKEYKDFRAYYEIKGTGKLTIVDILGELGVGLKGWSCKAQIYASLQGTLATSASYGITNPDGKCEGSLEVTGKIEVKLGFRVEASVAAKIEGNINSSVTATLAIVLNPRFAIQGPIRWSGIEGVVSYSVFGGLWSNEKRSQWMPGHDINRMDWPNDPKKSTEKLSNKRIYEIIKEALDGKIYRTADFGYDDFRKLYFFHRPPNKQEWENRDELNGLFDKNEWQLDFNDINYDQVRWFENGMYIFAVKNGNTDLTHKANQVSSSIFALDMLHAFDKSTYGNLRRDSATVYAFARWLRGQMDDMVVTPDMFSFSEGFKTGGYVFGSSPKYRKYLNDLPAYFKNIVDPAASYEANCK